MDFVAVGMDLVNTYGLLAIFLIGFSEPIFQPIPTEVFMVGGLALGLDWRYVILVSTLGSTLGGIVTYFIASKYGENLFLKLFNKEKYSSAEEFLTKWGPLGIIIISFTPIPFEVICWLSGIFKMPFKIYVSALIISRIIKHGLVVLPFAALGSIFPF
ncbi:YqaA family protein [Methanococcus maripaludis]|uniref:Membrane protein YqaA with SNARE-associated domain n=1 Tax=Methanococcus maripaludis TaxID=39152 RepID=A0A2L1CD97_METMI|nr:YqaA family protein [Methanococcus maripaludis]AVB76886.1 SNARE associated Golgi protein [Methanococcus maripaludis]MBA2863396.1 membrane protein YqaA with SNARE-associated domain [Methanococcus maripaludis]MBB6496600.1 membrane protein YqaA with SNARE-associated domain [Methanococcus maripaludis]